MRIELWRKFIGTSYNTTCCAVCGNDTGDLGSVFPVAGGDSDGDGEFKEMCLVCLDYLNARKHDGDDPTLDNWPAREWPTLGDLEEARRRYPEPMFPDRAALEEAAPGMGAEEEFIQASMIWRMEPEVLAE
jgi:hypothetical protein